MRGFTSSTTSWGWIVDPKIKLRRYPLHHLWKLKCKTTPPPQPRLTDQRTTQSNYYSIPKYKTFRPCKNSLICNRRTEAIKERHTQLVKKKFLYKESTRKKYKAFLTLKGPTNGTVD